MSTLANPLPREAARYVLAALVVNLALGATISGSDGWSMGTRAQPAILFAVPK